MNDDATYDAETVANRTSSTYKKINHQAEKWGDVFLSTYILYVVFRP